MAQVATGTIADRPFVRTVYTIAARRFTGDLRLARGNEQYALGWHRGFVVGAKTPVAQGPLGPRAAAIFAMPPETTFTLDDESKVPSDSDEPVDPRWLIYNGLKLYYAAPRLDAEVASLATRPLKLAADAGGLLTSYGFEDPDKPVVVTLREPITLEDLIATHRGVDAHRVKAIAYALLATDALEVGQPTAAPSRAHSARRTSTAGAGSPRSSKSMRAASAPPRAATAAPRAATAPPRAASVPPDDEAVQFVLEKLDALASNTDHFQLLGLERSAADADVRTAYFHLAKRLHPDRVRNLPLGGRESEAQQLFARINEAFGVLSDKRKRAAYLANLEARGDMSEEEEQQKMLDIFAAEEAYQLGELALRRASWHEAFEHFETAKEKNPDEGDHWALLGWARWCAAADKASVKRQVKKELRKALALSPKSPTGYYYRGRIAQQEEDAETARSCFTTVLELEPSHRGAQSEMRVLDGRAVAAEQEAPKKGGLLGRLKRK